MYCEMNPESILRTFWWAFLLANFSEVRVAAGMNGDRHLQCDSASFFLESEKSMIWNVSTCFTRISWDQVRHLEKREKVKSPKTGETVEGVETW